MTQVGWLVNDQLTSIPGTKTFWHDLLEWIPGLIDKTGGYTNYDHLADKIEKDAEENDPPDYIIRNATYFRKLNVETKQIALLQDHFDTQHPRRLSQLEICMGVDRVVFNSQFTCESYISYIHRPHYVIPLGTDFDFFTPAPTDVKKKYDIVFVGDSSKRPKGFDIVDELIDITDYKFALVMKDDYKLEHPRVTVFNKIDHTALRYILRRSKILICPSTVETLHLAGVEAMACGVPVVSTNVGIYKNFPVIGAWGNNIISGGSEAFASTIKGVLEDYKWFNPRQFCLIQKLDKFSCKSSWLNLIDEVTQNENHDGPRH